MAKFSVSKRKRFRYHFDIDVRSDDEKRALTNRIKRARQLLTPAGCPLVDNKRR